MGVSLGPADDAGPGKALTTGKKLTLAGLAGSYAEHSKAGEGGG
ncbi:MAG: hypothetical protein AB1558_08350 [Thermodesulfobacteriota bacterium]